MKICLINNLFHPFERGGAEKIVSIINNGLRLNNIDTIIITTKPFFKIINNDKKSKIYYLNSFYYNLNILPKFIRFFWHILDLFDIIKYFKIKSIINKEKPDIVITNNLKGLGYISVLAIKKLNIKHFHILHDIQLLHPSGLVLLQKEYVLDTFFAKLYQYFCQHVFKYVNKVISPSKWLLDEHMKRNFFISSKKIVVFNPFPSIKENAEKNKTDDNFTLLYVGQIEQHKGILFLIDTFKNIFNLPKIKLNIIGNGSELKKAEKLAEKNINIKFLGRLSSDLVYQQMLQSDFLIIPSLCYENNPTVIYEAAACALPVLASKIGGISEIVNYIGGELFEPNNAIDLTEKIHYFYQNRNTLSEISEKSKSQIMDFTVNEYLKKIL